MSLLEGIRHRQTRRTNLCVGGTSGLESFDVYWNFSQIKGTYHEAIGFSAPSCWRLQLTGGAITTAQLIADAQQFSAITQFFAPVSVPSSGNGQAYHRG